MSDDPLVTVVIPTYRRHEKLNRALRSVTEQTYENLEIIVVNDYPEEEIDEHIEVEDERIKTIDLNENRGGSGARNVGIEKSNGKYITFLDDDDEYLPEKVEKQVKKIQELPDDYGLVAVEGKIMKGNEEIGPWKSDLEDGDVYEELLKKNKILSVSTLVKKGVFENVGKFDEDLPSCQDADMWLRAAKEYRVATIHEPLVKYYTDDEERITADHENRVKGKKAFLEKHDDTKNHPEGLSYRQFVIGFDSLHFDKKQAREYLIKSIKTKFNWKSVFLLMLSLLPKNTRTKILKMIRSYYWSRK